MLSNQQWSCAWGAWRPSKDLLLGMDRRRETSGGKCGPALTIPAGIDENTRPQPGGPALSVRADDQVVCVALNPLQMSPRRPCLRKCGAD
eukprot:364354-Chlamydomonas_euryale.AAC.5